MFRYAAFGMSCMLVVVACSSTTDTEGSASSTVASEPTTTRATATTQAPTTTVAATTTQGPADMKLESPAFSHEGAIPTKHACDGEDVSPQLDISRVPAGTAVLVLIMDDPDAPVGTWDHWVAYDIPPTDSIAEGDHTIGTSGLNSWVETGYGGPCPPSGTHRYFFKLYALDAATGLAEGATKEDVLAAMEGHVLDEAEFMGTYAIG